MPTSDEALSAKACRGARMFRALIFAVFSLFVCAPRPVLSQAAAPITITSGSPAGGTYDATARLLARHLPRFLSGTPQVIVKNAPAAGGLVALNQLYNSAPRDGTALAVVDGALVLEAFFGNPGARFDPRKFNWVGSRARETPLCAAWSSRSVKTIQEAIQHEVIVGAVGGARTDHVPHMLNALIGTKFKVVTGYPGSSELIGALENGEINGICGWSWTTIKRRVPDWVSDNKISLLVQTGFSKAIDIPDVPLALDLSAEGKQRQVMRLLISDTQIASPLVASPGLPDQKIVETRNAFDAAMKDPQLHADAQQQQIDLDPTSGLELHALIDQMYSLPTETAQAAQNILHR